MILSLQCSFIQYQVQSDRKSENLRTLYFDVFKDGVFQKRISSDLCDNYDFMNFEYRMLFANERIYLLNSSKAELKVFSY